MVGGRRRRQEQFPEGMHARKASEKGLGTQDIDISNTFLLALRTGKCVSSVFVGQLVGTELKS